LIDVFLQSQTAAIAPPEANPNHPLFPD